MQVNKLYAIEKEYHKMFSSFQINHRWKIWAGFILVAHIFYIYDKLHCSILKIYDIYAHCFI